MGVTSIGDLAGAMGGSGRLVGGGGPLPLFDTSAVEQGEGEVGFAGEAAADDAGVFCRSADDEGGERADAAHDPPVAPCGGPAAILVHASILAMVEPILDAPVAAHQLEDLLRGAGRGGETGDVERLFAGAVDDPSAAEHLPFADDPAGGEGMRPVGVDRRHWQHVEVAPFEAPVTLLDRFGRLNAVGVEVELAHQVLGQQRGVGLDLDEEVGPGADDGLLHGRLVGVERVEGEDAAGHLRQRVDQALGGGDFLAFAGGELLVEKRGAAAWGTALTT